MQSRIVFSLNVPKYLENPLQALAQTTSNVRCTKLLQNEYSDQLLMLALQNLCIAAGHPISGLGGSTGSLTGSSSSASNGLSGTGTGSVASTTNSGSTTLSGTGTALGGSATATTTTGTGNGGKSSATGLTAQLGTIVVAVVLILAA